MSETWSKGKRESCCTWTGVIWVVVMVVLWIAYGVSRDSCNYKVDAKILDTSPHPKYAGQCLITLEFECPRSGCEEMYTQVRQFPNYFCQAQDQDGNQQSVVGRYIQGCVRDKDLDEFHPYYETNENSDDDFHDDDDDDDYASAHTVYSLFVAAMVITIIGFVIVAAATVWCMAARPRSTLPYSSGASYGSGSSSPPVAQPLYMQPFSSPQQPAQEMANASYPHIPPAQGAQEKPNPNLRM